MIRRGRLTGRERVPPPPGDFPDCGPGELPPGFAVGYWATVPLVEMVPYLEYLAARRWLRGQAVAYRDIA